MCLDRDFEIPEECGHPEGDSKPRNRCAGCVQGSGCLDWLTLDAVDGKLSYQH